jgi:hypothetical protein
MKTALIMMFRDEADILDKCLAHWQAVGIDRFFLCDNTSTDGSGDIARKYCPELMTDERTNWPGREIINKLKNRAIASGHTFIFPVDADEFITLPCPLPEWIERLNIEGYAWGEMPYLNILPDGRTSWQQPHRKAFGTFNPAWSISMGNHIIENCAPTINPQRAYYEHYSMRSYPQFKKKMENYMSAFAQLPYKDHPHAQDYERYQIQGEQLLIDRWEALTGLPAK